ncbi:23S rRNA (guanosine(2251)-2'-O)-methyltransferase RlmB [candidate division WOR-1 bacterium RIFOXYA12_FULL_52_29]|uniref:23S rRNA (Guanosine(2251)-2'-O)-methyltransferase RlmB n=1 Tax=candidate division WOR-1 bacterium RIFOXYC12_FULL_54_18 TaxID=1802584 RepID=A0A1F4T6N1_UNCSA|nr:MAG: 23S rRNA (guanosine(2251)-2'-O)-methyltransferase RlmB [candidate division WOR-1 bacterium RIFOXYA2_FULL_51_19]OGC18034.1 MAG: 23S rRNA (guanosine(2251)-2'-O)-methyltransferase RlmB [candidate division WOR-1 bacterium RIFOXYA12_FULL_52_29]OGC26890.1 MAG: 23S rRNA (guanosine(2251)-2'-O)-methyltransferase RlmB [candidate division WOR-1 bacterium RIFOXYB2_FULL_45_9]OGC28451.1 MAG: 23S rRNA (guanosine(2251)-2'-O)-methyltransferase RlmB [candidate division WOR-1 bacterium RIFOXYC12_FULL_54_18
MFNYHSLDDVIALAEERGEPPFLLILDGIEDPHNFGAILRTAEAAGVHAVIIRKARQVPVTHTVVKTSTGAAEFVPVVRVPNIAEAVRQLQDELIPVFAVEIDGKALYNTRDYKGPAAFVIGSEGNGVSRLVKERCSEVVRLPMRGRINSLNASVATGIVLYEVLRQRGGE